MKESYKKKILSILQEGEYKSAEMIAKEIGVSSKTVQKVIQEINKQSDEYGVCINSLKGRGYLLEITNKEKAELILIQEEALPIYPNERIVYIICRLLQNKFIKLSDIADEIFVSYATLTNDLKEVEIKLQDYQIQIEKKPYYGIRVVGSEVNKRNCMVDMVNEGVIYVGAPFLAYLERKKVFEKEFKQILEKHSFRISAIALNDLLIYLYIISLRVEKGIMIEEHFAFDDPIDSQIIDIATAMFNFLQEYLKVSLPETEKEYLMILLSAKQTKTGKAGNISFDSITLELANYMLMSIYDAFNVDFRDDLQLKIALCQHLVPLQERVKWGISSVNPMINEIKKEFPLCNVMAMHASKEIKKRYNKLLNEDEIGFIALSFALALEKMEKKNKKINICLVSAYGRIPLMYLEHQIKTEFSEYINEVEVIDVNDIEQFDFSNIDYVFTAEIINKDIPVPIIQMNGLSNEEQVFFIRRMFKKNESFEVEQFFDPQLFMFETSENKNEILKTMCDAMEKQMGKMDLFASVMKREEAGNTVFCDDVAMSHPDKAIANDTKICVSILKNAVSWEPNKKVHIVFLICPAKNKSENLTLVYRCLSKIVMNKFYINQLCKTPSYEVLMDIVKSVVNNK